MATAETIYRASIAGGHMVSKVGNAGRMSGQLACSGILFGAILSDRLPTTPCHASATGFGAKLGFCRVLYHFCLLLYRALIVPKSHLVDSWPFLRAPTML